MTTAEFFTNPSDQSRVKVEIVINYFRAWANVMVPTVQKKRGTLLGYVDLYAGPGQYDDGTKSTPALIIEEAIRNESLRDLLVTRFNDVKPENITRLERVLSGLPGFGTLKHQPRLSSKEVTDKREDAASAHALLPQPMGLLRAFSSSHSGVYASLRLRLHLLLQL